MGNRKSKTVKLLLEDGTLKGVMSIVDSSWNPGEMYSAPKESVDALLSTDACKKFGVYLLLSDDKVYIGQSMDLAKRVSQHVASKKWWERVIILTTADDSLNRADIDYLEYYLIQKAQDSNRLDSENKKKGNMPKVDKFRKPELEQYLEEALFLLELIGISVFSSKRSSHNDKSERLQKKSSKGAVFYLKRENTADDRRVDAQLVIEDGKYIVKQGSLLAQVPTPTCQAYIKKRREECSEVIKNGILQEDMVFDKPSGASGFVLYASSNGKIEWRTREGISIGAWEEEHREL
ncbi:MAG: GIY-YIG nuclease family protein [Lachnospiraceae bacterium]|nr:GIY-YIG nuclease family protein [Lachnospiraceae bacterium]MBQ8948094.1 GIY-YIG nuclease family protein [Lachnospiraceae bacterium]